MSNKQRIEALEKRLDVHSNDPILVFTCSKCEKPQSWINRSVPKEQGDADVGKDGWCECPDNPYRL